MVEKSQTEAKKKQSLRVQNKSAREKLSVNEQMKLDTKYLKIIEDARQSEREKAVEDFLQWRQTSVKDKSSEKDIFSDQDLENVSPSRHKEEIEDDTEKKSLVVAQQTGSSLKNQITKEDLPEPGIRSPGKIEVYFTPREFPTPSRESKLPEEEEWLQRQAAARKATGFMSEDLRPEECDPQWLKEKGDSFFKLGNYLGAVSAYSHGIKLSNKMAALFSNRSAAHLKLNNLYKAVEDASQALELLQPAVEANRESRAQAHVRRGTGFCKLGSLKYGLMDFEAALKLIPSDDKLRQDVENIKLQILNDDEINDEGSGDEV